MPQYIGRQPIKLWFQLLISSAICAAGLSYIHMPAAFLLGPMVAAIIVAVRGNRLAIPPHAMLMAQAVIGCLIANSITPRMIHSVGQDWLLFASLTSATLLASSLVGYLMTRWQVLPGTSAIWGSMPGAAMVMTIMGEAAGADQRLVALMQYMRVICVALIAALFAWLLGGHSGVSHGLPAKAVIAPFRLDRFALTALVAVVGALLGKWLRLPAWPLMGPFVFGGLLNLCGLLTIELPRWLLTISYAMVGWKIGLDFSVQTLKYMAKVIPQIALSIATLMCFCAALAAMLVVFAGIDPVSAYLATSPGGLDSITIIAATSSVNVPFVIAVQVTRFVAVLFIGPILARAIAARHDQNGSIRADKP